MNKLLDVPRMDDRYIQAAPFVDANAETNSLGSDGEHCWVVAGEDNAASWRNSGLNDTNNVRNRQTHEEGPHGKVLEAGW